MQKQERGRLIWKEPKPNGSYLLPIMAPVIIIIFLGLTMEKADPTWPLYVVLLMGMAILLYKLMAGNKNRVYSAGIQMGSRSFWDPFPQRREFIPWEKVEAMELNYVSGRVNIPTLTVKYDGDQTERIIYRTKGFEEAVTVAGQQKKLKIFRSHLFPQVRKKELSKK